MASNVGQREEFVLISDALAYIAEHTGFEFERRQFTRYVESGVLTINGSQIELLTYRVGARWFVSRCSIERIIEAFAPAWLGSARVRL